MMRVVDYIAAYIYNIGVKEVFMVSGGGMMFLSDGLAQHSGLKVVCNHHEQASAMAAVSYAKYNGHFGVCYVTTGCGGTNAITGLLNAWQDSIPCMFISGQTKRKETIRNSGLRLRQFGVQEADIIAIVGSITKYAVMINDPNDVAYHLEKAFYISKTGRPGPVWLDVPLDVQGFVIDENKVRSFSPDELVSEYKTEPTQDEIDQIKTWLLSAQRPVIIAGQGVRLGKALEEFRRLVESTGIPVVASRLGIDCLPSAHPLFIGRIGNKGDRAGNLAVQNADMVIAIGSRLSVSSTGHEYDKFAREARIIVVDIDPEEHRKNTVKIDLFVNADAGRFLRKLSGMNSLPIDAWSERCRQWKARYPVCLPEYASEAAGVNLYYFIDQLSEKMKPDSVVVSDAGSAFFVTSQGVQLTEGQRYITSGGQAEMGYTLPAAIGVSVARGGGEVIGITGDGSFQMNIQELQTIVHYGLPIKIFVWNNNGYLSIRATQSKFFNGRFIGTDKLSGVSFPDLEKIASAYGIKYFRAPDSRSLGDIIRQVLEYPGAVLCEVICLENQEIIPTIASQRKEDGTMVSKPPEDMYPFLDRDEFYSNMMVKPIDE
jgi:acetolactate synthase-1/2/3 large subunit